MSANLQHAIELFRQALVSERGASKHTVRAYAQELARFAEFLGPDLSLADVDHKMIRSFLGELHGRGLAKPSIARSLAALKSFFKWLGKEGLIHKDPAVMVSAPKLPKRLPRVPSMDEMDSVLSAPDEHATVPERDRLILELLYGSGLRNSECQAIRMEDVAGQRQVILVRGKGKKERMVPFSDPAAAALKSYLPVRAELMAQAKQPQRHDLLLVNRRGSPLTSRSIGRIVKRLALQAGLPSDTHPHTLRHAFGTHMLAEGADLRAIQELLGHERISTTQIYTQLSTEHIVKVYDETHPRAK